jgi:hypothetical protein
MGRSERTPALTRTSTGIGWGWTVVAVETIPAWLRKSQQRQGGNRALARGSACVDDQVHEPAGTALGARPAGRRHVVAVRTVMSPLLS